MRQISYLLRKGARYHFRRRLHFSSAESNHIRISLGTADPMVARRLARRLAVRWDEVDDMIEEILDRQTLTAEEQRSIFRSAMFDELAHATRHHVAPIVSKTAPDGFHRIMAEAYRTGLNMGAERPANDDLPITAQNLSTREQNILQRILRSSVGGVTIPEIDLYKALDRAKAFANPSTIYEAKMHMLRGRIEAHERARLIDHPVLKATGDPMHYLGDDAIIQQIRSQQAERVPAPNLTPGNEQFAQASKVRFSEQISQLHDNLFGIQDAHDVVVAGKDLCSRKLAETLPRPA